MGNYGRGKILIIDDIKAEVNILKAVLKEDYDINIVFDGKSALEKVIQDPPDLILLDIMMPKMDGYEVFDHLKRNDHSKDIPIVFITSKIEEKDETKGLELGAIDYITKPFSIKIVTARLKNLMLMKQQQDILKNLSSIDGLTGIPNRRRFDQILDQEWRRAIRGETYLSLIMLDIDFFKNYNDYYGHAVGDDCLKSVAKAIQVSLNRSQDFAARFGGEEFSVILPETRIEGAFLIAEKIRKNVKAMRIPHKPSLVSDYVTISAGVSSIVPLKSMESGMLIQAADRALYKAKHETRDSCYKFVAEDI